MSRRCCCVTRDCEIHADTFITDRLAAEYTEVSGDWSVDTAEPAHLEEAGNAGAILKVNQVHPIPDETGEVWATLMNSVDGTSFSILGNYKDSGNYLYGRVDYFGSGGANTVDLTVGSSGGGDAETVTVDVPGTADDMYRLCYGPKDGSGNILLSLACDAGDATDYVRVFDRVSYVSEGYYIGLRNNAAIQLDIFELYWYEHFATNPNCDWCMCTCDGEILIPHLTATIISSCGAINGLEFALDYDEEESDGDQSYVWWTEAQVCDNLTLRPKFVCESDDCGTTQPVFRCPKAKLTMYSGCTEPCTSDPLGAMGATGDCNPLDLTFGPYTLSDDYGACGCCPSFPVTFYVELTE